MGKIKVQSTVNEGEELRNMHTHQTKLMDLMQRTNCVVCVTIYNDK